MSSERRCAATSQRKSRPASNVAGGAVDGGERCWHVSSVSAIHRARTVAAADFGSVKRLDSAEHSGSPPRHKPSVIHIAFDCRFDGACALRPALNPHRRSRAGRFTTLHPVPDTHSAQCLTAHPRRGPPFAACSVHSVRPLSVRPGQTNVSRPRSQSSISVTWCGLPARIRARSRHPRARRTGHSPGQSPRGLA
jgi:hypothetical protein